MAMRFTMNRASFPSLMSKGGNKMMYGKKKPNKKKVVKKKAMAKRKPMKKRGY